MPEIKTNRDLYLFVTELIGQPGVAARPLSDFLRNLRELSSRLGDRPALSAAEFAQLLQGAAEGEIAEPPAHGGASAEFKSWLTRIDQQIEDMEAMERDGTMQNELRYLGFSAPSRRYWFNFDTATYLECACVGTFGGWEDGDSTGRRYVPGEVAGYDPPGEFVVADPREFENPVEHLGTLTWKRLASFLDSGQLYE